MKPTDTAPAATRESAATMDVDLAAIRYRVEDGAHYVDCDRFEVYDYGCRQGKCDCNAAEDLPALLAVVDELTVQRDLARDAAVALEQENARLQNERESAVATLKAEARAQMEGAARRDRSWPGDVDVQRLTADAALRARTYRHAAEIVAAAAVLGLGLQPETSEQ